MSTITVKEMLNRHLGSEAALQSINEISGGYREGLRGKALKSRFSSAVQKSKVDFDDSSAMCAIFLS
ncbi:MAG: hypothetical protein GTO45_17820 [Candidatus Aminicenantes bacterium]|nr:hypothetical protein [Candidatus Aminicenantes bacterium]NIM84708.1 hypothetical protein [Candidatus Aminicenantes bacterium]NIN18739.1 hypothetical protein [Candidatus Aminicenantes bacterium]NIN42663.1 hypothetical protein [Candidatus Aminicenantes bacterium]NIN86616.1 hypothetical protein [Candidatus Aminicenantes bacterium]